MAISIGGQWHGNFGEQDAEIVTNPATGRMMVAVIASRVVDGSTPTLNIGDMSRNGWTLIADPFKFAISAHVAGQLQVEVWACPAVQYAGWPFELIYVSAMQISAFDVGSVVVNVAEVAGTTGQLTVDSVTLGTASAATSITLTAPAPAGAADCLMIAAAVADVGTAATPSGTGWTALTGVTDTNPNIGLGSAWREATTGGAVTFTLGTAQNWAGVVVSLLVTGVTPPQPNPNWPITQFLLGLGYGLSTPLSRVVWTDQTTRLLELAGDHGIQAELGTAELGTCDIVIDNRDDAYTPRAAGSATANAAGTTTTIKIPDAQAVNIHRTDFFRLKTAAGALKELNVFQVVSTSSSGGTTTVTFTRADGSGAALSATASGDVYVGVPIDLYIPFRQVMTWAGQPYVVSSGWLRDLPVVYDGAAYAELQAVGTDVMETLTASTPSALRGEILRRNPTHYWPLDDPRGAGYAANASGVSNSSLTQTASKFGVGASGTADFGASTHGVQLAPTTIFTLLGDPGTGWAQDGLTSAEISQKGYALVGSSIPDSPPIAAGVTVFGFMVTSVAQDAVITGAAADSTLMILRNSDPGVGALGSVIKLAIDKTTEFAKVTIWDKVTSSSVTAAATSAPLGTGTWALTFNQTSWTLYTNGTFNMSGAANLVPAFTGIDIGGEADQFFHGHCFPGLHGHIAVFGRILTPGEISVLDSATIGGEPHQEMINWRIRRKLDTAGWTGTRILNSSDAIASADGAPGGLVADVISEVAGYQDGLVFPDGAGQLQYRDRPLSAQQSLRATLGENTAAGELPYEAGMSPSFSPIWVYNDVRVSNAGAPTYARDAPMTTLVAMDDASVGRYGARTLQRSTHLKDSYRAWHVAWWWLARYATPQRRVETITVSAEAAPERWPFVLGVEVGDLVAVTKRQIGVPPYTIRCQVLRVQPHFSFGNGGTVTGSVTLTLAAAAPPVAICGDPVAGVLGGTVLGI